MPRFRYKVGQVVQHIPQTVFEQEEIGIIRELQHESAYWADSGKCSFYYHIEWIHLKDCCGYNEYSNYKVTEVNDCIRPADATAVLLYG